MNNIKKQLEKCISNIKDIVNRGKNTLQEEIDDFLKSYETYETLVSSSESTLSDNEKILYQNEAKNYNEKFWRDRQI
tara:strand:- start:416 stop:646 length:231 start_codon:yes stop_codon:yes gene_type:complete